MSSYDSLRRGSLIDRLRFILRDSVLYGVAAASNKLLSLFILPLLTRIFSEGEYGVMDALSVWAAVVVIGATFGQDSAVARFFYETEDQNERRAIVGQALLTNVTIASFAGLVLFVLASPVVAALVGDGRYESAVRVIAIAVPFTVIAQFFRNLLKWTFSRAAYIAVTVGSTALILGLTVVWVVVLDAGVVGVFYAQLAGQAAGAAVGLWLCRHLVVLPKGFRHGRSMLRFGWPFAVVGMAAAAIPAVDRYAVGSLFSLEDLGRYAVSFRFASLMSLPILAFQTAWGPFALAIYKEKDAEETYGRVLLLFLLVTAALLALLMTIIDPVAPLVASARYQNLAPLVFPLALGLLIEGTSWITGIGIDLSKRTTGSLYAYVTGLAVLVSTIVPLAGILGVAGVAWAVVAARASQTLFYTLFAMKVYPLRFPLRKPAVVLGAVTIHCFLAAGPLSESLPLRIVSLLVSLTLAVGIAVPELRGFWNGRRNGEA